MKNPRIVSLSRLAVALVLLAAVLLAPAAPISAAAGINRYVSPTGSNTSDCSSAAAPCQTIAYALTQSSDSPGGDTLLLDTGLYIEHLTIKKSIRIVHNPAKPCCSVLSGGSNGRVIDINTYAAQVSLEKITIRNGELTDDSGAGIRNNGILTLDNVILHHNIINLTNPGTASYAYRGGAIDNQHQLTIRSSSVHDNSANDGGGISTTGPLTVQNTEIYANSAQRFGGGIWVPYGAPTTLENTTLYENSATVAGGGMYINSDGVAANRGEHHYFKNVTISGNTASGYAGGLVSYLQVEMDHSTLAQNIAPEVGADLYLYETQTLPESGFPHSVVTSTIITNPSASAALCYISNTDPFVLSDGHNLSRDSSCGFSLSTDQENTDPGLLPLADNGGYVQTRALPAGSPAIDHAGPYALGADARGIIPMDGDLNGSVVPDVGAYEFVPFHVFLPLARR